MEEKERFEYYLAQNQLYDKTNDELYCFGIEQDKTRLVDFLNLMNEDWWALYIRNKELREENQQLKQQLRDLPKKIVQYFYDEIRHRAILEEDYCPDHNLERKYGVRECLLEDIRTKILKKFGGNNESIISV